MEKLGLAAAVGSALSILHAADPLLVGLLFFIGLDIVTGVARAAKMRALNSSVSTAGGYKKLAIMLSVFTAYGLDAFVLQNSVPWARAMVTSYWLYSEALSVTENLAILGAPLPSALIKRLEKVRNESDEETGGPS